MRLSSVRIDRYRCVCDFELDIGPLTGLIGMNGTGKSAILRAIAAFYGESDLFEAADWFGGDLTREIQVALTFVDLSEMESEFFSRYISTEGQLHVERVWRMEGPRVKDSMYGHYLACSDFMAVRQAERGVAVLHNALVDSGHYDDLQRVTRADQVEDALRAWELEHLDRCEWVRDSGRFFLWNQPGGIRLAASSVCVYVPAVREARSDAAEGKGSALSKIVDLVLRDALRKNQDLSELRESVRDRFGEILQKTRPTLSGLADELSALMADFTPGSAVSLDWRQSIPALPDWPLIEAKLSEDGVETPVWAKGHGLQRSFIVSLLQRLAELRAQESHEGGEGEAPHTLLLVEEPELYQHPLAAKRFATVLRALTEAGRGTQVVYTTHDPAFVSFDHFDAIRRVEKLSKEASEPPQTNAVSLSLRSVGEQLATLWELPPEAVTDASTRERLRTVLTHDVSEGFFARAIVLVEGIQDRALLEGLAAARGLDLVSKGIAILPVAGKSNLDKAYLVFTGFGIRTYLIFDGDKSNSTEGKQNGKVNSALLQMCGLGPEEFPASFVSPVATVFEDKLEAELRRVAGEAWDDLINQCCQNSGLPLGRDVLKTAYGCKDFVVRLADELQRDPIFGQLMTQLAEF